MKKLIFIFPLLACMAFGQLGVRTENASNSFYHKKTLTALDTVLTRSSATGTAGYLVGVVFNHTVASDTLILLTGIDTIGVITTAASGNPVYPFYVPYGCKLDSLFRIRKASIATSR
jgi:hypothetical protein